MPIRTQIWFFPWMLSIIPKPSGLHTNLIWLRIQWSKSTRSQAGVVLFEEMSSVGIISFRSNKRVNITNLRVLMQPSQPAGSFWNLYSATAIGERDEYLSLLTFNYASNLIMLETKKIRSSYLQGVAL
jgi:hypothetical protein